MNNNFIEFFGAIKEYLTLMGVDAKVDIEGCSDDAIRELEIAGKFALPLAYKAYLQTMGKHFLFEFMDAENMAYAELDYCKKLGEEFFESNSFRPERPYLVISERRNEYVSFIYLDEGENPPVRIIGEEDEDATDPEIRNNKFTELIIGFVHQTLHYFPMNLSFGIFEEDEIKKEKIFYERVGKLESGLREIKVLIASHHAENEFLNELDAIFASFIGRYFEEEAAGVEPVVDTGVDKVESVSNIIKKPLENETVHNLPHKKWWQFWKWN